MKIGIITDTHSGIKNGSDVFINNEKRFYDEIFFPELNKRGIKDILHLGDYFDHRKFTNIKALAANKINFIDKLRKYDMHMHVIAGNHDVYHKNSNDICSLNEIIRLHHDVVSVHMKPGVVDYDGLKIALLPWINSENYNESLDFVQRVDAPILGAHLELSGFEMMRGMPASTHGMNADLFSRFESVYSGHYHTKSTKGNIHYLGTPYELTWADCDDPKYFHILDTSTRELEAIRNPICLYNKLVYDDSDADDNIYSELASYDFGALTSSYVKLVVRTKKNPYLFDKFVDAIHRADPFEVKIIENFDEYNSESVSIDDEAVSADTVSLLNNYVDAVETDLDRDRIKTRLQELYVEAQALDSL
jgi:DNA repair exonuclease SbcCD nuclease subunit